MYRTSIRECFSRLKLIEDSNKLRKHSIGLPNNAGTLVPLCVFNALNPEVIEDLAQWREEHMAVFPTQFPVTLSGTAEWIQSGILDREDRILFLIENADCVRIGHIGYANCINDAMEMEIDNVIRGREGLSPGIMSMSIRVLLHWAQEHIHPHGIFLRVFNDNTHAVEYYRRAGFLDDVLLPLRLHSDGDRISYLPVEPGDTFPPDKYFLKMVYRNPEA